MTGDNLTASNGTAEWDPDRYDPDDAPNECLECGARLSSAVAGGGASRACPDCDVLVWVM